MNNLTHKIILIYPCFSHLPFLQSFICSFFPLYSHPHPFSLPPFSLHLLCLSFAHPSPSFLLIPSLPPYSPPSLLIPPSLLPLPLSPSLFPSLPPYSHFSLLIPISPSLFPSLPPYSPLSLLIPLLLYSPPFSPFPPPPPFSPPPPLPPSPPYSPPSL